MYGFFLIDKPSGITSFDVIRDLRKKFHTKKMGHTGTLDPLATGCLLVAVGEYTKLIPYLEKSQKTYIAEIELGATSDSHDSDGEVLRIEADRLEELGQKIQKEDIENLLQKHFYGEILQLPPKVSALKIGGKTSLERLRNGEEFELQKRPATIYQIELLDYNFPKFTLHARVSAGTYIRSIARDIGEFLSSGAILTALRRTQIDHLYIDDSTPLENIEESDTLDVQKVFHGGYFIETLSPDILERLSHGQRIAESFDFPIDVPLFYTSEGRVEYVLKYDGRILSVDKRIFS